MPKSRNGIKVIACTCKHVQGKFFSYSVEVDGKGRDRRGPLFTCCPAPGLRNVAIVLPTSARRRLKGIACHLADQNIDEFIVRMHEIQHSIVIIKCCPSEYVAIHSVCPTSIVIAHAGVRGVSTVKGSLSCKAVRLTVECPYSSDAINGAASFSAFSPSSLNLEGVFGNRYVLTAIALLMVFQLLFTYLPIMQILFGTGALDAAAWLRITGSGLLLLFMVEFEKRMFRTTRSR